MLQFNYQGGWEIDESMEGAVSRETQEEAGVLGYVGVSIYKIKKKKFALFYFSESCIIC